MSRATSDESPLIFADYSGKIHNVDQLLLGDACPQCGNYDACEYRLTDSKERPGYYLVGALCRVCGGCTVGYQPDPERLHPDDWSER